VTVKTGSTPRCVVALVLLAAGCASPAGVRGGRAERQRIAIISAFGAELAELRAAADITEVRVVNGRTVHLGRLAGHDVALLLSGTSMVNAAMTAQALLDRIPVRAIVFSGVAGGVNPELGVGDVTVPARWGNYQEQIFAREGGSAWDPAGPGGEFPAFGMMIPRSTSVAVPAGAPDRLERRFWFEVDPEALEAARRVAATVHLERCLPQGDCLGHAPRVVTGGNGVSGPTFVDNAEYRRWVWETFRADALDMETAAVAQVAYVNRVPFIAFRSLSDLAGGGPGANEGRTFAALAARNASTLVIAYLGALPRPTAGD
jgi:adenosylhomocysteine nucleosidase